MVGIQTTTKGATVSRPASLKGIYEASDSLVSLFVHDDRQGPYRSAAFVDNGGEPRVVLQLDGENEDWKLTHILVPAHPKIRLGFPSLRDVSLLTAKAVQQVINDESAAPLLVSCRIVKAVQYVDELVAEAHVDRATITTLTTRIALSRYVACIQVSSRDLDALDVLIDTTTTLRTAQALAVVAARRARPLTEAVADGLADNYLQCPVLV
jgi:hypothetical protein